MRHEFINQTPVSISSGPANTISSEIHVPGLAAATIEEIEVTIDISHTWTADLIVRPIGPEGTEVVLARQRGGSRDDFRRTIFRANAATPIADGRAPFRGTFRPEEDLSAFHEKAASGTRMQVFRHSALTGIPVLPSRGGGSRERMQRSGTQSTAAPGLLVRLLQRVSATLHRSAAYPTNSAAKAHRRCLVGYTRRALAHRVRRAAPFELRRRGHVLKRRLNAQQGARMLLLKPDTSAGAQPRLGGTHGTQSRLVSQHHRFSDIGQFVAPHTRVALVLRKEG
jgi:hypothetical protein